jgi:hypothetical protein
MPATAGGAAGGGRGVNSYLFYTGHIQCATGGGSSNSVTGGAGGDGMWGSGGGGGGAGATIGGAGGRGGDGQIILCWF